MVLNITWTSALKMTKKTTFEMLPHPPDSPALAPNDFHLSQPLKEALRGCNFCSDKEVKRMEMYKWF